MNTQIILEARVDFAKTITKGNHYVPVSQTKTGFLVKGDDGYEVDLYIHFFRVGIIEGENINLLPEHSMVPVEEIKTEKIAVNVHSASKPEQVKTDGAKPLNNTEVSASKELHSEEAKAHSYPVKENEASPTSTNKEPEPEESNDALDWDDDF